MSTIKAAELFAAIGRSVSEAQNALLAQESERFWSYFSQGEVLAAGRGESLPAGTIERAAATPMMRVLKIALPGERRADDAQPEGRMVYVPVASVVPHASMALAEVRISLNVQASMTDGELYLEPSSHRVRNADWTTPDAILYGVGGDRAMDRIELIYRAGDAPEGTLKVVSKLNQVI